MRRLRRQLAGALLGAVIPGLRALAAVQGEPGLLPTELAGVTLGTRLGALQERWAGLVQSPLADASSGESLYVTPLEHPSRYFSEAAFGVAEDRVSFIQLAGPRYDSPHDPETLARELLALARAAYGGDFELRILGRSLSGIDFREAVLTWELEAGTRVHLVLPTPETVAQYRAQRPDHVRFMCRVKLFIRSPDSLASRARIYRSGFVDVTSESDPRDLLRKLSTPSETR